MYFSELKRAMEWLAEKDDTLFLGQAVNVPGTAMSNTLVDIAPEKLIELPVAEDMQMGMTIGLAMENYFPITIFPRWNFLLLATNQLVNHLDKIASMSVGAYQPRTIVRTSVGAQRPLHPQHQHVGDFSESFRLILKNIDIVKLEEPEEIVPAYQRAYKREDGRATIMVEYGDYYNEK